VAAATDAAAATITAATRDVITERDQALIDARCLGLSSRV
jgi:hypothetical protein